MPDGFCVKDISEDIIIITAQDGKLADGAEECISDFMCRFDVDFCYADEDYILEDSKAGDCKDEAVFRQLGMDMDYFDPEAKGRMLPWFKPDFSPETLLSFRYTGNIFACRVSTLKALDICTAEGLSGDMAFYDFLLKLSERTPFGHINKVLFHNTKLPYDANLPGAGPEYDTIKKQALLRRGISGRFETVNGISHIVYELNVEPFVSILIPSKDNPGLVRQCVDSVRNNTDYRNYEIILVDNGSTPANKETIENYCSENNVRYFYEPSEFNFSAMCNFAARNSIGDYLLFLNDDIEIADSSWMKKMAGELTNAAVGSVGVKLMYPGTKKIQHCGISNSFIGPVHRLQGCSDDFSFYYGRNKVTYNYIGATAACLMVRRDVFDSVGGFCEDIKVAYNDVDLCFKIYEAGFRQVVRNDVTIYHHESITRGRDDTGEKRKRLDSERETLYLRHPLLAPVNLLKDKSASIDPYCPNTQLWIRSSLFRPGIAWDYEDVFRYSVIESLPDDFVLTKKGIIDRSIVMVSIDSVTDALLFDEITGWAAVTKKDNVLYTSKIILFSEDGKKYAATPFITIRDDVERSIEGAKNLLLSGIRLRVKKGDLPPGRYQVGAVFDGIISKKRYAMLSESFWEIV